MFPVPSQSIVDKIVPYALLGVGGIFAWKYFQEYREEQQKKKAEGDIANVPEARQADRLYQLLHPFNDSWWSYATGENADEEGLINYAPNITDFKKVQEYYGKIAEGKSLLADLRLALNTEEYDRFMNSVPGLKATSLNPDFGKIVQAASTMANLKTTTGFAYTSPWQNKAKYDFAKGVKIGPIQGALDVKYNDGILHYWKVKINTGETICVLKSQVKVL